MTILIIMCRNATVQNIIAEQTPIRQRIVEVAQGLHYGSGFV